MILNENIKIPVLVKTFLFIFSIATDALSSGIATHYCESRQIPDLEKALLDLKNVGQADNVINSFCPKLNVEFSLAKHIDQINKCFDAETIEEILTNLEKDNSEWAKQTIKVKSDSKISIA